MRTNKWPVRQEIHEWLATVHFIIFHYTLIISCISHQFSLSLSLSLSLSTGIFINPSGISDICGTVAGMVMPKGSMSTEGQTQKTWRDSLHIDMLLSAVSVLVVAQPSSEVPEGLTNYPVYIYIYIYICVCVCVYIHMCVCVYIYIYTVYIYKTN